MALSLMLITIGIVFMELLQPLVRAGAVSAGIKKLTEAQSSARSSKQPLVWAGQQLTAQSKSNAVLAQIIGRLSLE
jgi:hypothetical protein